MGEKYYGWYSGQQGRQNKVFQYKIISSQISVLVTEIKRSDAASNFADAELVFVEDPENVEFVRALPPENSKARRRQYE